MSAQGGTGSATKPAEGLEGVRAKALLKMAMLMGVSVWHPAVEVALASLKGHDRHRAARRATQWARDLRRILGIVTHESGQRPQNGAIIVANHRSYVDISAVMGAVPCAFLAKAEVAEWPVLGHAATVGNTVYVKRESAESRKASRQALRELLDDGISVAVFPEGTTTSGPGTLDFRPGVFAMAVRGEFPIVPAAIMYHDPDDAWVGDDPFPAHFLRRFSKREMHLSVCFGPEMRGDDVEALRDRAQDWVRETLARWEPERAGQPLVY